MKPFLKIGLIVLSIPLTLGIVAGILNLNKSAESTKQDNAVKPHSLYLQGPLDLNTQNVGAHFLGHHIGALTEYVKEANRPREEFESSPEYEKRKAKFLSQSLLGMPLDSYLAFTANFIGTPLDITENLTSYFEYDADKQAFAVHVGVDKGGTVILNEDGDGLALDKRSVPEMWWGPQFSLRMPPEKAKAFKPVAKVVLVCKSTDPWYKRGGVDVLHNLPGGDHEYVEKRVDLLHVRIEQLWIINSSTGEVVQKIHWPPKGLEVEEQIAGDHYTHAQG